MLTFKKNPAGKLAAIKGPQAELMLFYTMWQTKLWPEFFSVLGDNKGVTKAADKEVQRVLKNVADNQSLSLYNGDTKYKEAFECTCIRFRGLGLELVDEDAALVAAGAADQSAEAGSYPGDTE